MDHLEARGRAEIQDFEARDPKSNNTTRQKNHLHSIIINHEYLEAMNIILKSVPSKGKRIVINPVSNFHNGGFPTRVPLSEVHPDNLRMLSSINRILGLNLSGIDILIPDIRTSYKSIRCAINEVNKFPNFDIHWHADNMNSNDFCNKFLRLYFDM